MVNILGIIPARGGSKSVPRKNIAPVGGKPLIAWTIEVAHASEELARVVVSTDDAEIADVARRWGAEVPFMRPADLAQDDTPGVLPLLHAVSWLEEHEGYCPDYVMLLQPTSPLRTEDDIKAAVKLAQERSADSVVSVTLSNQHPFWMKTLTDESLLIDFLHTDTKCTCRQDLPPAYAFNGAIYLTRRNVLLNQQTLFPEATFAYVMPAERSLDVDTPWDLYVLGLILEDRSKNASS